ncbi:MAG: hypothetical protein IT214_11970 [Chitinophagaceae bacterium]|jgi:hypothetical protein|nr:hypothetical protein [Chitinophagaceae bacterium]OQY95958.1 MAG: hypothetical protein B6D37_04150 [Sphingobacteriales bacterium UTBCD1]
MKKKNNLFFLFLLFFAAGCTNNPGKEKKPENDIDAARDFIRAALDGKFDIAKTYMLQDSSNIQYLDAVSRNYQKLSDSTKDGYRESSINIHLVNPVNDSTTVVVYSNSFMKDKDTLKVCRLHQQWLVDLKYIFEHNMDTLINKQNKIDTIQ